MLNIVCVNAGNYQGCGVEYVRNLARMVREHCTIPHKFICFSDSRAEDDPLEGVDLCGLPHPEWSGWWHKISLFRPGLFPNGDRVLYFDLSTVIMGNIDILADCIRDFCMAPTFGATGPFGGPQSGVMAWEAGAEPARRIYESYLIARCPQDYPGGDQKFIIDTLETCPTWPLDLIKSYKWHLNGEWDGSTPVVCCHGHPKPHEIVGWAHDTWAGQPDSGEASTMEVVAPARFDTFCNTEGGKVIANILDNARLHIPRVQVHNGGAVVVGGGPSAVQFLDDIDYRQKHGAQVFALNGAARWLTENGVVPDYHVLLDARPENITFLQYDRSPRTVHLLSSQCDPSLFALLFHAGAEVRLWHVGVGNEIVEPLRAIEPGAKLITVGSTVGVTIMNLLLVMGYRRADLFGYDSSNAGETVHHAYPQPMNDGEPARSYLFEDKAYMAPAIMAAQAKSFMMNYQGWEAAGLKIVLHGDGLLPSMWRAEERARAASSGTEAAVEAYKYRRAWQMDQYREYSPGETLLPRILEKMGMPAGASIIDFGCGSGRLTQKLKDAGFAVLGIDHAANCLDHDVHVPFCVGNLWALPDDLKPADYGICCDVMEHIPEAHVDAALENIKRLTRKAVFFNIDHKPAVFGHAIGVGDLHVTVKDAEWWREKLAQHWRGVRHSTTEGWFICYQTAAETAMFKHS